MTVVIVQKTVGCLHHPQFGMCPMQSFLWGGSLLCICAKQTQDYYFLSTYFFSMRQHTSFAAHPLSTYVGHDYFMVHTMESVKTVKEGLVLQYPDLLLPS